MSIDRGMGKDVVPIYIRNAVLLSDYKEGNNSICSNVDGSVVILSEVRGEILYGIPYMWN